MAMAVLLLRTVLALLLLAAVGVSGQTHHFFGGEDGWDPHLNLTSWLDGRVFKVGDKLWFNYSAPEDAIIVELNGPDELESCDLSNPIKMYTDHVPLDKQGIHYFASGNPENCRSGLKLTIPVELLPEFEPEIISVESDPWPWQPPPQPFWPSPPSRYPPPRPSLPPPSRPSTGNRISGQVSKAMALAMLAGFFFCIGN